MKLPCLVARHLDGAAVQFELGAFLDAVFHQPQNAMLRVLRDDGAQIGALFHAGVDLERLRLGHDVGYPLPRFAHQHGDRGGHAALSGRAEGRSDQRIERLLLVGVRHDDGVILGAHHALHALAVLRGEVVDVRAHGGRADEGDGGDVGVRAQRVDGALAAMDDVQARRAARRPAARARPAAWASAGPARRA